jgi:hypothetical protein
VQGVGPKPDRLWAKAGWTAKEDPSVWAQMVTMRLKPGKEAVLEDSVY